MDRYVLLTTKQTRGKSFELFYGKLIEQAKNCQLGNQFEWFIRYNFTAFMLDIEKQRELSGESEDPQHVLTFATTNVSYYREL